MATYGIETFEAPIRVDFNPDNEDHLAALALMHFHGRQHPTIRFRLDPTKYGNVYMAMVDKFIRAHMPADVTAYADNYAASRVPLVIGSIIDGPMSNQIRPLNKGDNNG